MTRRIVCYPAKKQDSIEMEKIEWEKKEAKQDVE